MLDLSSLGAHSFWNGYDRHTIYRIICLIEGAETWTVDHEPKVQGGLNHLAKLLDKYKGTMPDGAEPLFVHVLANIKMAKAVRILQSLDQISAGYPAKLLMYAEDTANPDAANYNKYSEIFLKRNLVFERLQLFSRIFAAQRFSMAAHATDELYDD